jgi:hypothetical protein
VAAAPGLSVREVMAGGFALGETDPAAGERAGRDARTILAMHARVAIPDLARFVADADHVAVLAGHLDFDPFGGLRPAESGIVQLFAPTGDVNLKLMVYRMTFSHAGSIWCLDGQKHVRRHSVLHAWRDTTTLYCRLYKGTQPGGPVLGAGTLHLTALAFARQLTTFRTTGTAGLFQPLTTMAGFGRFFARELIDSYDRNRKRHRVSF